LENANNEKLNANNSEVAGEEYTMSVDDFNAMKEVL
jgi:hypothetical protein